MRVLIGGDYCPRYRLENIIENEDYNKVFSEVRDLTAKSDYSIVNFECPIVLGEAMPIEKHGPNLKCTARGAEALKWAGFDCFTLANNHFYDYGCKGVKDTLNTCKQLNIDTVGGGLNIEEASQTLYKVIDGKSLAIINCCEHEFSIAKNEVAGSNPLNPIKQYYAIKEAGRIADYVLVIVHGGHEFFQLPSLRMVETYRFFIDAGASAVINHHQHCYSGFETYKGKLIFYGLGNFCFDNVNAHEGLWTEAYLVSIDFSDKENSFKLHPIRQCASLPKVEVLPIDSYKKEIDELNSIISKDYLLEKELVKYYSSCAENYSSIFEPFYNRLYLGAMHRGWVPSLINKQRLLAAQNFVCCEAHRDKLTWFLDR